MSMATAPTSLRLALLGPSARHDRLRNTLAVTYGVVSKYKLDMQKNIMSLDRRAKNAKKCTYKLSNTLAVTYRDVS